MSRKFRTNLHANQSVSSLLVLVLAVAALVVGCAKSSPTPSAPVVAPAKIAPATTKAAAVEGHGVGVALGKLSIGGYALVLTRHGEIAPGHNSAVSAKVEVSPAGQDWRKANLYVWAEDAAGERLNAPERAVVEGGGLHLHTAIDAGKKAVNRLVFRLRSDAGDVRQMVYLTPQGQRAPTPATPTPSAAANHGHPHPGGHAHDHPHPHAADHGHKHPHEAAHGHQHPHGHAHPHDQPHAKPANAPAGHNHPHPHPEAPGAGAK
mgnify:CR=1 FL=1